jgi:hypothetical protein
MSDRLSATPSGLCTLAPDMSSETVDVRAEQPDFPVRLEPVDQPYRAGDPQPVGLDRADPVRPDPGADAQQPAADLGLTQPDRGLFRRARRCPQRTRDRRPRQGEVAGHAQPVRLEPGGQRAPQQCQLVQPRAVEQRWLGELARLEPQWERDVHAAEIEPVRDLRVPDHQPARIDIFRRPAQVPDVRRVDPPVPEVAPAARPRRS